MEDNNQAVMTALGYSPLALPQAVMPVTKTENKIQRVQYAPDKIDAVMLALQKPRNTQSLIDAIKKPRATKTRGEIIAEALAGVPEARSFTGAYGTEVINPWAVGLSSLARGFGSMYGKMKESERESANTAREDAIEAAKIMYEADNAAREDAIKAAQTAMEADKTVVENTVADDWLKYNLDPNAKQAQAEQEANRKLAETAYVKLNPHLGDEIRKHPEAFSYAAREADLGSRTVAGGETGILERGLASIAKAKVGDEALKTRARLLQEATQYVAAITNLSRQNGASATMMNSDKEGQRNMAMFANPSAYSAEELAAGADYLVDLYERMAAVANLPSVVEGYDQVTQMVEARKPKTKEDVWSAYRD